MQLMPGDVILMKLDTFQGKRKVKDRCSEVEYVVTHQVTSDVPTYKVKGDGGNIKVTHRNRLFLVAPVRDTATPLGGSESVSYVSGLLVSFQGLMPGFLVDSSLIEKDVVAEEPVVEVPPTREGPAAEYPVLVCLWPPDSQEEDQVEVHTPKRISTTGDEFMTGV